MLDSEYQFLNHLEKTDRIITAIARKGAGKTYFFLALIKYFMNKKLFQEFHLVLPTYEFEADDAYEFFKGMKNVFIYNKYSPVVTDLVIKAKKRLGNKNRLFFGLDDSTGDMASQFNKNDSELLSIFTTSRHIKITLFIVLHSFNSIMRPANRGNIDYLFIFSMSNEALLKMVHEEFLSMDRTIGNFNKFKITFDEKINKVEHAGMLINAVGRRIDYDVKDWQILKFNKLTNDKLRSLIL